MEQALSVHRFLLQKLFGLKSLRVGCWNVSSLVMIDSGVKSAIVQHKGCPVSVENFLVHELKRFCVGAK